LGVIVSRNVDIAKHSDATEGALKIVRSDVRRKVSN
jgi:hypothetical protein